MRQATALKVADLLASVEGWLETGRPRKRPGKPRFDAEDIYGNPVERLTSKQAKEEGIFSKLSLPAAFRLAAASQGYSRYVKHLAMTEVLWEANIKGWANLNPWENQEEGVEFIDYNEPDTRQVIRYVRAARKYVQRTYGI